MNIRDIDRRHALLAFALYLAFVVYGSLVPFQYRDYTFDRAIERFASIPYLDLGVVSRADWVANILLYVPLAFLGCVAFLGMRTVRGARHLGLIFVFALCLAVAVAVEFAQIFFAPRTVSLNDLLAETLGSLGGIGLWAIGRSRIAQLWEAFAEGGRPSVVSAIVAYGLLYIALGLFPYDFVVSARELAWKLESGRQGWLISGACGGWLRCSARLAGDAVAIAPLGLLMAMVAPRLRLLHIFVAGVALGVVLEAVQLLLASGSSQGLSAVVRGAGLAAGAAVGHLLRRQGPWLLAHLILKAAPYVALPYVLVLAGLNGWFSRPWVPVGEALERLGHVRMLPFYYHYFSTETRAMASLLANAAMYAPLGLVVWARRMSSGHSSGYGASEAAIWAVLLALPIELGKLLVPPKHPDFTDLLIAAGGAVFTCALAGWAGRVLLAGKPNVSPAQTPPIAPRPA